MTNAEAIIILMNEIDIHTDYGDLPEEEWPEIVDALRLAITVLLKDPQEEEYD